MKKLQSMKDYQSGGQEAFVAEPMTGGTAPKGDQFKADTTIPDPIPPAEDPTQKLVMFGGQPTGPGPDDPTVKPKVPGLEPLPDYFPPAEILKRYEEEEIEDEWRAMPADCQGATAEQEEITLLLRSASTPATKPNASQQGAMERGGRGRRWIGRVIERWGGIRGNRIGGPVLSALGQGLQENATYEVVIGPEDSRQYIVDTSTAPFSGCAQLDIVAANGRRYVGSAAMVAMTGNASVFLTAAHCVYFHDNGGAARTVEISPGRDVGTFPFGRFEVNPRENVGMFVIPPGWTEYRAREDDWAIVVAPHQFTDGSGETPHVFKFKAFTDKEIAMQVGQVSGYPVDLNNLLMDSTRQFYHADDIAGFTERVITYLLDTTGGQSGSPFWFYDDQTGERFMGGVHTMGDFRGNSATRITPEIVDQLSTVIQQVS